MTWGAELAAAERAQQLAELRSELVLAHLEADLAVERLMSLRRRVRILEGQR